MNQREQYNALVEDLLARLEERLAEIGPHAPPLAVSLADLDERGVVPADLRL